MRDRAARVGENGRMMGLADLSAPGIDCANAELAHGSPASNKCEWRHSAIPLKNANMEWDAPAIILDTRPYGEAMRLRPS